ncbi:MAG: hypothetical protein HC876_15230 [Chloroflexaceae bacterium]|nr:hypothetical protein [Chloroflexaceae bacterium]
MGNLINSVVTRLRPRFAEHHVTVALDPHLPSVPTSYMQIDQVLTNLLETPPCIHHREPPAI